MSKSMYIIAYDIADGYRLRNVAKIMENYGVRIQKSIFYGKMDERRFKDLHNKLVNIIEPKEDSIFIQPLCSECFEKVELIGTAQSYTVVTKCFAVL